MRSNIVHYLFLLLAGIGCAGKPNEDRFEISLHATSDDASPLANVTFGTGKSTLGTSNNSGVIDVRLRGVEGQTLPLRFTCPAGYDAGGELPPLRLTHTRRVGQGVTQAVAVEATCIRKLRDVVLVVRSDNASNLPVHVDGKPAAVTVDGTAHLLLHLDRDVRKLTVALDTTDQPKLRPQNPSRTFDLHGKDTVLVTDQAFVTTPTAHTRPNATPKRHVPYRIQ